MAEAEEADENGKKSADTTDKEDTVQEVRDALQEEYERILLSHGIDKAQAPNYRTKATHVAEYRRKIVHEFLGLCASRKTCNVRIFEKRYGLLCVCGCVCVCLVKD